MSYHAMKSLVLGATILLASSTGAFAQAADETKSQTATRVTGWAVQCVSQNRAAPLACKAEQQMLLAETNQLFIKVTININWDPARGQIGRLRLDKGRLEDYLRIVDELRGHQAISGDIQIGSLMALPYIVT